MLATLFQHVGAPLVFALAAVAAPTSPVVVWWIVALVGAAYVAFIVIAGAWSWFGRAARWSVAVVYAAALAVGLIRAFAEHGSGNAIGIVVGLIVAAPAIARVINALRGRRAPAGTLALEFPLRGGAFHVAQGGATRAVNYHHAHRSQRYALDIVRVNADGRRARGVYPRALDRYASTDADVVSPCDGIVRTVVNDQPDFRPPERDHAFPAGNYVAVEMEVATVYLAHLARGSVAVRAGDHVHAGQMLARVGNSGNTTEPHLHIHAERGPYVGMSRAEAMPITLGGRFLARNDIVRV